MRFCLSNGLISQNSTHLSSNRKINIKKKSWTVNCLGQIPALGKLSSCGIVFVSVYGDSERLLQEVLDSFPANKSIIVMQFLTNKIGLHRPSTHELLIHYHPIGGLYIRSAYVAFVSVVMRQMRRI